jgi:hypothetical protein
VLKKDEAIGEWRKLHNEELNDLYCSPRYCSGGKIEKSEMGRACSAYGRQERHIQGIWWGNLREKDHLGDPGVDGRIILRWIFRKRDVEVWTGASWLRTGTVGRLL